MKKIIIMISSLFLLAGCSLFDEVTNSADYVSEATNYIQTLSEFGQEVPGMIQEATSNVEVADQLYSYVDGLQNEITSFINIDPPKLAEDIHQQLVTSGEDILTMLNNAVDNGEVIVNELANSEIFQTINNVTNLLNAIQNLGL